MMHRIVFKGDFATLVGAGSIFAGDLEASFALAPKAIAADGGAVPLLAAGWMPEVVVGDIDSLTDETRAALSPHSVVEIAEQDSTDFEKALARIEVGLVLGVGFTGARLDHTLAALHVMLRFADRAIVLLSEHEAVFLAPRRIAFDLPAGATVSLYPLAPVTGRSTGLEWPIDGLHMRPGAQIGTSNRALGGQIVLECDNPGMIVLVPKSALGEVTQALMAGAPEVSRWPARA